MMGLTWERKTQWTEDVYRAQQHSAEKKMLLRLKWRTFHKTSDFNTSDITALTESASASPAFTLSSHSNLIPPQSPKTQGHFNFLSYDRCPIISRLISALGVRRMRGGKLMLL